MKNNKCPAPRLLGILVILGGAGSSIADESLVTGGSVASLSELEVERGGAAVHPLQGSALGNATLSNNTAISNNVNSYNVIESGAFSDTGGIVSVMQNTGNNVILQNVTTVNVNLVN